MNKAPRIAVLAALAALLLSLGGNVFLSIQNGQKTKAMNGLAAALSQAAVDAEAAKLLLADAQQQLAQAAEKPSEGSSPRQKELNSLKEQVANLEADRARLLCASVLSKKDLGSPADNETLVVMVGQAVQQSAGQAVTYAGLTPLGLDTQDAVLEFRDAQNSIIKVAALWGPKAKSLQGILNLNDACFYYFG